jgi:hypothetical protein
MNKRVSIFDRGGRSAWCFLFLLFGFVAPRACAQDSAFTYQGQLRRSGAPANGNFDIQFRLWNADGIVGIGAPVSASLVQTVTVSNGLFTTQLDFGALPFTGALIWMEMGVRTNGASAFTPLAPRQPLTATPYAVRAAFYSGPISEAQLPATVARLDQPLQFTNLITLDNAANTFVGSFTGTGVFAGGVSIGPSGNAVKKILHGSATIGESTGGVKAVTITFPTSFASPPRIVATPRAGNASGVFGVTTHSVGATQFDVNILRLDTPGAAWSQGLQLDWIAWE